MHRSGTSALTRVLGLCGAALPRHLMPGSEQSNPLGHWEPSPIVDAHDRFLAESGTGWADIFEYPNAIFHSDLALAYQRRLEKLAIKEFGDARLFVLKDPRTSRLMPMWRSVLWRLGAIPGVIIVVRNPLEVAESLLRRDGLDEYHALVVWVRHMLSAERDTRGLPRCFVRYDDLMDDWRSVVTQIAQQLHISLTPRGPEIDRFLTPEHRRHRRDSAELFERADIADCIKRAYRCFCSAVDTGMAGQDELDAITQSLNAAEAILKQIRGSRTARVVHPGSVEAGAPAGRDALLALVLAEFGRAQCSADAADRRLETILASRSWRMTALCRKAVRQARRFWVAAVKLAKPDQWRPWESGSKIRSIWPTQNRYS